MAFWLSGKVAALQLDNSTSKAYLCNQGGTTSLFLSWLAYCILNMADKCGITLIRNKYSWNIQFCSYSSVHTYPSQYGSWLSQGRLVQNWHLLPHKVQAAFLLQNQLEVDLLASSHNNQCQHYYYLENPLPQGSLGWKLLTILDHIRWVMCFLLYYLVLCFW